MKKGFTLIELMIVVVVMVTLMTISFRLGGIGDDTSKRNRTINRMQRLENCLSGYYAAYGSYPPVKLHGSRDYTLSVNVYGLQCEDTDEHETDLRWESVQAACKSQPLSMCYPFPRSKKPYVDALSKMKQDLAKKPDPKNNFEAMADNATISSKRNSKRWIDVQLFKFGVMSYLLPRYLIAMGGGSSGISSDVDSQLFTEQEQWKANNQLPCRFESGVPYENWSEVKSDTAQYPWKVAVLPSQAVCARWLPNLEETVATTFAREIYGVNVRAPNEEGVNDTLEIYDAAGNGSGGKGSGGGGQNYALQRMTVVDGWGQEFYYYSLPPHQSYILWSGGPNKMTFPHWITGKDLNDVVDKYKYMYDADGKKWDIQQVIADDMVQMSN